jgi:hypothetical protein
MRASLFPLLFIALLSGCAVGPPLKPVDQFVPLESDPRVWYEPGGEIFAERVAAALPAAIAQVEAAQYRPFPRPVRVHVCATEACFANHVATSNLTAAVVPDNRLFLAPRLFTSEPYRLPAILTHELSHVHLGQQIGHFTHTVPVWFHEGLAAYVSEGGGAEYASEAQAVQAINSGKRFDPVVRDSSLQRNKADHWGLSIHLFYRESMMFVAYLKHVAADKFRNFLVGIENREDFDSAFVDSYHISIAEAGHAFFTSYASAGAVTREAAAPSPTQTR